MEKNTLVDNRYRLKEFLGSGSFGEVWLAEDTALDNMQVAVKLYISLDNNGQNEFSEEYKVAYGLNHQYLLKADYYSIWEHHPYLVMKYCSNGSVAGQLGQLSERDIWKFIHDVSAGLAYLHSQNPVIIHQDIKPENILIDDHNNFLITDFGISKKLRSTMRKQSKRVVGSGALAYMGPERFLANPIAVKASDIWSLGVSIYELAQGDLPFAGQGGGMLNSGAELPRLDSSKYSSTLNEVMQLCLAKETWDRPTAEELEEFSSRILRGEKITWAQFKQGEQAAGGAQSDFMRNADSEGTIMDSVPHQPAPHQPGLQQPAPQQKIEAIERQKKKNKWLIPLCCVGAAIVIFFVVMALIKSEPASNINYEERYNTLVSLCESSIKNGDSEKYTNILEARSYLDSIKTYETEYPELKAQSKYDKLSADLKIKAKDAAAEWAEAGRAQLEEAGDDAAALQYYQLAMIIDPNESYSGIVNSLVDKTGCRAGVMIVRDVKIEDGKLLINYLGVNKNKESNVALDYVITVGGKEVKGHSNITIEPGMNHKLNINLPSVPEGEKEIALSSNGIQFYSQYIK